ERGPRRPRRGGPRAARPDAPAEGRAARGRDPHPRDGRGRARRGRSQGRSWKGLGVITRRDKLAVGMFVMATMMILIVFLAVLLGIRSAKKVKRFTITT